MRDTIPREELHRRFTDALAARSSGDAGTLPFEIDDKNPDDDGCNWYPLAAIQHWTGDLKANLAAFRSVRQELSSAYNLSDPRG